MKYRRLALLAVFALGACTGEPAPVAPSPTAPPTAADACPGTGVAVTTGLSEAATGLRVLHLELTNCGDEPYELTGHPELRVLDDSGDPLTVRIGHGSSGIATVTGFDDPPRPLSLRPGEVAETLLMWKNTTTDGTPQLGSALSIAPMPERPWQPVEVGEGSGDLHLDLGTTGELGVSAWRQAATPEGTS
ncbi:DUF4232 domain-containing protein [Prauserella cavernicola]|uniref:DUF4232 domain-containing protein n=1 Tax=Prauserella cavernicola TaxID=2800127 RepID=A0A934V4U5_9PSEU|nr:DUF4232 domain-containing protein [Prauserella cavernicola]MBK1783958.1 DUF4232 domain-containing protein [Prauserella cavernicola]